MMKIFGWCLTIILVIAIGYGSWVFKRWANYSWSYEDQVKASICDMVKPEYLKNPQHCKIIKN